MHVYMYIFHCFTYLYHFTCSFFLQSIMPVHRCLFSLRVTCRILAMTLGCSAQLTRSNPSKQNFLFVGYLLVC